MGIAPAVVQAVHERAAGYCELCGLPLHGKTDLHHRKLRSQGGADSPENLVVAHHQCHMDVHANPARSYEHGHLVRSFEDPAVIPVVIIAGLCGASRR